MQTREQEIIKLIASYCEETGLSPATVGTRATGDSKIYDRLLNGGSCGGRVYQRISDWYCANKPKKAKRK